MKPIHSLCICCTVFLLSGSVGSGGSLLKVVSAQEPATCKVAPLAKTPRSKVGDTTPAFTWKALEGCTNYQLYLASDIAILSITWVSAKEASCSGGLGNCTYETEHILPDGDYGWWIRGWKPGEGTSKWSSGMPFTVDKNICAKRPKPLAPIDTSESSVPVYQWTGAYGCEWYQLSAAGLDGNIFRQWVNGDDIGCVFNALCSFSPAVALPPGDYKWWIRGWSRGTRIGRWTSATTFSIPEP